MALSGTFYGTTNNENIRPKIVWSATQSVTGNYSTVTATLYYSRTNTGYTTKGTGSFSLTINGNKASASKAVTLTYNSNTMAITHKVQVTHTANGTKSITISATGSISGTSMSSTSISSTVALNTIPRATTPTLDKTSANIGDTVKISTPRASSSFTHVLEYKFVGTAWLSIATGVGTSYSWKLPDLSGNIPNAANGTLSIRCTTKSGNTTIGTKTVSMTLKVPYTDEFYPRVTSVSVTDATAGLAAQFGVFIQNKSKLKVSISAKGAGGSAIKSYSTTVNGKTYTTASFTTDVVTTKGQLKITTTVKDSRNRSYTHTETVDVQAYNKPRITEFSAYRTDGEGKPDSEGNDALILFNYEVPALKASNDYKGNTAAAKIEYKRSVDAETEWKTLLTDPQLWVVGIYYTYEDEAAAGVLSVDNQYDLRLTVTDYFGEKSTVQTILPSGRVIADIKANGKGIGIGKTAELDDTVDMAWDAKFQGDMLRDLRLLWDGSTVTGGGWYMHADQVATLTAPISDQLSGAVFAWSAYADGVAKNQDWHFFFVPKSHINTPGAHGVWMCDPYMGLRKYVYVNDSSVKGHTNNNQSNATNGIGFNNLGYVLRYIVGV